MACYKLLLNMFYVCYREALTFRGMENVGNAI